LAAHANGSISKWVMPKWLIAIAWPIPPLMSAPATAGDALGVPGYGLRKAVAGLTGQRLRSRWVGKGLGTNAPLGAAATALRSHSESKPTHSDMRAAISDGRTSLRTRHCIGSPLPPFYRPQRLA
jgi:hypothetical protein